MIDLVNPERFEEKLRLRIKETTKVLRALARNRFRSNRFTPNIAPPEIV